MSSHGVMLRAAVLMGALVGLVSVYFVVVRPWSMGWGATAAERARTLPGDALVPSAPEQETRAITVQAPAEQVWPWVAQLGQDRGGFYSYEILEDLVGCEIAVVHGVPFQGILETDKSQRVDLIVMGTHGRTGFQHLLLGSVAEKVVRLASCPVLVVRQATIVPIS